MEKIRIGIVGCGEVAQIIHLPSFNHLEEKYTVTALCDVSKKVLSAVGEQWRIPKQYLDYHDLIAQSDVDAVLITNPHAYHAEVAIAAIEAGKHVMIEKPMCVTLREADEINAAQARKGVVVQVGQMRRYAPAFVKACELVREMDDIYLARVHDVLGSNPLFIQDTSRVIRADDIPEDVIAAGQQRFDELTTEAIGEVPDDLRRAYRHMLGLSSHDISAMRELLGMPQRVLHATQRYSGNYLTATFDYGKYVCHFESGHNVIPLFDAYLKVYGKERILNVQYNTPYVRNLPIHLTVIEANGQGGVVESEENPVWGDAFVSEWRAFYDNVMEKRTPKTPPSDFRQDLELFRDMIALMRQ